MNLKKFVLFDFDGVIADSFPLAHSVASHFDVGLTEADYRTRFHGNIFTAKKAPKTALFKDWFALYEPRMKAEVGLFAGMKEVIEELARSYALVIVSSTTTNAIKNFLASNGLLPRFTDVMGADVHTSKVEKMRMIFDTYKTSADHCVFITDTLGDVHEAKEHTMGVIGCSWGFHSRETLEEGTPFRIVEKPADIPDAVGDYFSEERH